MGYNVVTLTPNALVDHSATFGVHGTAYPNGWGATGSMPGVLNDASDSTYASAPGAASASNQPSFGVDFTTSGLAVGQTIGQITIRVRASDGASGVLTAEWWSTAGGQAAGSFNLTPTITTYTFNTNFVNFVVDASNIAAIQAVIDGSFVEFFPGSNGIRIYEVAIDLYVTSKPVVTVVNTPASNTPTPMISWAYTSSTGDQQSIYALKVFSSAQYGAGGFDPETSTPTYLDGFLAPLYQGSSSWASPQATVQTPLAGSVTYKAYVKIQTAGGFGWSDWTASAAWQVAGTAPATPTITSIAANANGTGSITVNVQGHDNLLSANQASLETDTSGWAALTNCSILRDVTIAKEGGASLRMTSSAGGDMKARTSSGLSGAFVTAGRTYSAVAWFRGASLTRTCSFSIDWYDVNGNSISSSTSATVSDPTNGTFNAPAILNAVAPVNARFASITAIVAATGGAGEIHSVDEIGLFPANISGWTAGGYISQSSQRMYIQRSIDGGVTWSNVTQFTSGFSASLVDSTGGMSVTGSTDQQYGITDFAIPIDGTSVSYRAYATGVYYTGSTWQSAYSSTSSVASPSQSQYFLRCPTNSALNIQLQVRKHTIDMQENIGMFDNVLGQKYAVVVADSGSLGREDGKMTLQTVTAADWTGLTAILNYQGALFLQTPDDGARWIRITKRSRERIWTGSYARPLRQITIEYVEVAPNSL